jgi:hypothetical protein
MNTSRGTCLLIGSQIGVVLIVVEAGIKLRRRTYHICPVRLSLKAFGTTQEPEADPCALSEPMSLIGHTSAQTATDIVASPQKKKQSYRSNAITMPNKSRTRRRT